MVTIYSLKDSFKLPSTYGVPKPIVLKDNEILDIEVLPNHKEGTLRGKNLDVSNVFTGDVTKIKNIHFIKGTYFDRDYFRRLYPNINVRTKPDLAEVFVYDNKALYENDNVPISVNILDSTNKTYFTKNCYSLKTLHSVFFDKNSFSYYDYNKQLTDNGQCPILMSILKVYNEASRAFLIGENSYYDHLTALKRPFLKTEDVLKKIPSNLRQNNLTLDECITYFHQITSGDPTIVKSAIEAVIMYNSDKYLPIQVFLYSLIGSAKISNKVGLFHNTNSKYVFCIDRERPYIFNLEVVNTVFERIEKTHPNVDWELTRKLITSYDVFSKFNNYGNSVVKVNGIDFEIIKGPLVTKKEKTQESSSIEGFML